MLTGHFIRYILLLLVWIPFAFITTLVLDGTGAGNDEYISLMSTLVILVIKNA